MAKKKKKQKYKGGTSVVVCSKRFAEVAYILPEGTSSVAVVDHTYYEKYGSCGHDSYRQYSLRFFKGGKEVNRISWFDESDLTAHGEDYTI